MLRTRSFMIFLTVTFCLIGLSLVAVRWIMVDSIDKMDKVERRLAEKAMESIRAVLKSQLTQLAVTTRDWAFWDATYRFIDDLNHEYIEENLTADTLPTLYLKGMLFYDKDGELRHQASFDFEKDEETLFSEDLLSEIQSTSPLFQSPEARDCTSGIFIHEGNALLAAACPILTSQGEGPARGTLIFLREIDQEVKNLWQITIGRPVMATVAESDKKDSFTSLSEPEVFLEFFPDHITGKLLIPGLQKKAVLVLETLLERSIHRESVRSVELFATALLVLTMWALGALWYFVDRKVFQRIGPLVLKIRNIPSVHENTRRESHVDEIAFLRKSIDDLLSVLERNVEEKLEQHQELHTILESNPVGIILVDAEKRTVTWANSKALELMGRSLGDILNKPCKDVVCPAQHAECPVLDKGRTVRDIECNLPTSDGRDVPVLQSIAEVTYNRKRHLLEAVMDLRPQKALESQLDRAKKLETVGLVAGGVAHDLNNLLTTLVGYPDMLLRRIDPTDPMVRHLTLIRDAGLKAGAIVQDLLSLARRGVKRHEHFDLSDLVHRVFSSLEFAELRSSYPEVRFQMEMESRRLYCVGSEPHLEKALLNLVRNAVEAVDRTGTVHVVLSSLELNQPKFGFETVPPGRWILVKVQDTGIGVAAQDLPHLFEPFYTKKKMGRSGTGLGMTIVWHAIKDMGGFVDVESTPGRGTTFTLYLPEADPPTGQESKHEFLQAFPRGSGEKILVVEDMEDQRTLMQNLLTDLGYRVTTASNGREALALAAGHKFDALVLDMRLGDDMDGPDVYREIQKHHPNIKALIVSGDVSGDRVAAVEALGVSHFLPKPYGLEKLAEAVYAVLHEGSSKASNASMSPE
ncbi:MAG: CHASE4 domain-containing protein [Desulfosoma sp.]